MAPYADDGSVGRPHTLLITDSHDVHIHHIFLHNSTDWTFRMVCSRPASHGSQQHDQRPLCG